MWYIGVRDMQWVKMVPFKLFVPDSKAQFKATSKAKLRKRIAYLRQEQQDYIWESRAFMRSQLIDLELIDDLAGQSLHDGHVFLHLDTHFYAFSSNPYYDYWNPFNNDETGPDISGGSRISCRGGVHSLGGGVDL